MIYMLSKIKKKNDGEYKIVISDAFKLSKYNR